jgi:hypothetical protein
MNKVLTKLGVLFIASAILTSCGGGTNNKDNKTAKITPETTEISGDLAEYIEVVDGEYEVIQTTDYDKSGEFLIKIKSKKQMPLDIIKVLEGRDPYKTPLADLSASLLNENKMPISGIDIFELNGNYDDKLISLLKSGNGEQVMGFTSGFNSFNIDKYGDQVKYFSVSSILKIDREKSQNSSSISKNLENKNTDNSNTGSIVNNNSENWDEMLDDYEEYVDEYIKLLKKANNGDASAISEYSSMMNKAKDLQQSMVKAQNNNELNASQIKRMMKIQTKMANAAMKMQN